MWLHDARQSRSHMSVEILWDNTDAIKGCLTVMWLHWWSWAAMARSSSPCSHGIAVSLMDFSRSLWVSRRRAAAQFIPHGLLVVYLPACAQVTFVCSVIWSSVIRLSYFASCKNSTAMRFDLFPATEIIVSCLLPWSSEPLVAIFKWFFQSLFFGGVTKIGGKFWYTCQNTFSLTERFVLDVTALVYFNLYPFLLPFFKGVWRIPFSNLLLYILL